MQKVDPFQIYILMKHVKDNRQGTFSYEGGVTNVMQELTGRPAESCETTARRYAPLPFAQQTLANCLRAFVNFNIALFHPGFDIDAYERRLEFPVPSRPLQCMEDDGWRKSHAEQMALQGQTPEQV